MFSCNLKLFLIGEQFCNLSPTDIEKKYRSKFVIGTNALRVLYFFKSFGTSSAQKADT